MAHLQALPKRILTSMHQVSVHKIKGGSMNKENLCLELISVLSEMEPIPQHTSAFLCFMKNVRDSDSGTGPTAQLELFKYCTIIQDNVS